MKKKQLISLVVVLIISVLVSSCSSSPGATSEGTSTTAVEGGTVTYKDTLITALDSDVGTLNPFELNSAAMKRMANPILETLITYDGEGKMQKLLITDYKFDEDCMGCTIYLKKNVKFHNGEELTADDVMYTLESYANGKTKTEVAPMDLPNCKIIDKYTIYIRTKYPYSTLIDFMRTDQIVNKKFMESGADTKTNMVGTGPFVLKEYVAGDHLTYTAFEDYHGGAPKTKTLIQRFIKESSVAMVELEAGNIDAVVFPLAADIARVQKGESEGITFFTGPNVTEYFALFNNGIKPFNDVKVRQAVAYAMNREDIVTAAFDSFSKPVYSPIPFDCPGASEKWKTTNPYPYDVNKAKELLAQAGYPNGMTVTLLSDGGAYYTQIADVLIHQLAEIGITVKLAQFDTATVNDMLKNTDDWNIVLRNYTSPGEPLSSMELYGNAENSQKGGSVVSRIYDDPIAWEYAKLLKTAASKADNAERAKVYNECEDLFMENIWYLPLVGRPNVALVRDNVKGAYMNGSMSVFRYAYAEIKK